MNYLTFTTNDGGSVAILATDIIRVQSLIDGDWAHSAIFVSGGVSVYVTESFDAVMTLLKGIPAELAQTPIV